MNFGATKCGFQLNHLINCVKKLRLDQDLFGVMANWTANVRFITENGEFPG